MPDPIRRIVVVGGSIAAVESASTLRQLGFEGDITVLSDEAHPPYSRVPLSKGVLAGREPSDSVTLRGADAGIELRCGVRAAGLDPAQHLVRLAAGGELPYDRLIVATGARPRRLTADGLTLRSLDDCTALRDRLAGAGRVIVVGAGFLGMEIASTCLDLGLATTVVDREPPLLRLTGPLLAQRLSLAAAERGLRVVTGEVAAVGATKVRLADDRTLRGDVVVEAVGDVPNVEWLHDSGLQLNGGVVVDARCRAAQDVVAAGDVAISPAGGRRSPHWTNALEQARAAATTTLHGLDAPAYAPSGYYWTEQFGVTLRVVGELPPHGDPDQLDDGLLCWRRGGVITTVATVNHRMPVARMRRLLADETNDSRRRLPAGA